MDLRRAITCALALGIDAALGDPSWIRHPVIIIGSAINRLEDTLRQRLPNSPAGERHAGRLLVLAMTGGTLAVSYGAMWCAGKISPLLQAGLEVWWGWQSLAMRGLWQEADNVERQLRTASLDDSRAAVGRIVGRDTERLDERGVARAAVESVAESFSDGVVAPMLYLFVGGAPLALCYKAVNTMDSMVGYKNDRYLDFGRAAAHADDVANFVPSRIAAILLVIAAGLCGADVCGAWRIWRRDRRRHASPNSAQTESAMAGALGIELGGPAWYFGMYHDKPTIGDDTREPVPADIGRARRIMVVGSVLCLALCAGMAATNHPRSLPHWLVKARST